MEIVEIPVALIDDRNRVRPVTPAVAEQLAWDIEARGLRQPIEVAKETTGANGMRFRLISGGHRLEAFRRLRRETIPAIVVAGQALELRRDELLENLARNELSKLERAQFLAELKQVYQALHPETKAGGDRKSAARIKSSNLSFDRAVAQRADWSAATVRRATAIGERLSPDAAELLRGTPFEDSQSELEALAKVEPENQPSVVRLVVRPENPLPSIRAAVAYAAGRVATPDSEAKQISVLLDRWNRAGAKVRRAFIQRVMDDGFKNTQGDVLGWVPDYEGDGD